MIATLRALSLAAVCICALSALVIWAFRAPTARLAVDLPAREVLATSPQILWLDEGARFPGSGRFKVGEEWIEIRRATRDGRPVALGPAVAANPNSFLIIARGALGTEVKAHTKGSLVRADLGRLLPAAEGPFAAEVDELFQVVLYLTALTFFLTQVALIASLLLGATRKLPGRPSRGSYRLEAFYCVLVLGILLWLAFAQEASFERIKDPTRFPATGPVSGDFEAQWNTQTESGRKSAIAVQIIAARYQWAFRLCGHDGQFGTADDITSNALTLPAGRDVLFTMRAIDVIHSFFLPHFRLKQDAVPGLAVQGWFRAEHPGTYPILCAELCGSGHTYMSGEMRILPEEEFLDWFEDRTTESILDHLGVDNREPDFDEDELDVLPRAEWYGVGSSKFWWWWDKNPVPVGYAGSSRKRTPK